MKFCPSCGTCVGPTITEHTGCDNPQPLIPYMDSATHGRLEQRIGSSAITAGGELDGEG